MIDHFKENDAIVSGKFLSPASISLTPEQLDQAIALSESLSTPAQQWQNYINILARMGVEQWIQKRVPQLAPIDPAFNELPTHENLPESLCFLTLGEVTLCLIATEMLYESAIPLPRTALDHQAHFYVWVEVLEELEEVTVRGFLWPESIPAVTNLPVQEDQTYLLPIDWFNAEPDQLLLSLRTATQAAASPLPATSPHPVLQQAINVQRWLANQLDQVAQDLSWVLLPPLSPSLGFRPVRSPVEEFNEVMMELVNHYGLTLPSEARGAYRDFQWESLALRLYVVTWQLPLTGTVPEWTLLLVLSGQPGIILRPGLRLQVQDEHQILEEPVLTDASQPYLYAQVIGSLSEQFRVTISLTTGSAITLPPFTFEE